MDNERKVEYSALQKQQNHVGMQKTAQKAQKQFTNWLFNYLKSD